MIVDLQSEGRVEDTQAPENSEEVVVAPEKHVQAHLDVVAIFVLPAPDFASHERPRLENFNLVPGLGKVHGCDHPRQPPPDNTDLHFLVVWELDLRPLPRPDIHFFSMVFSKCRNVRWRPGLSTSLHPNPADMEKNEAIRKVVFLYWLLFILNVTYFLEKLLYLRPLKRLAYTPSTPSL